VTRLASPCLPRIARLVAAAALTGAAGAVGAGQASATTSPIALQTATAAPIAASNRVCTAEPRALIYGTTNYNAGSPLSYTSDGVPGPGYYLPANAPSALDLVPAVLAGARSDLCLGFTLQPDVESPLIRTLAQPGDRLQDTPAWADVPETNVVPAGPGDPAPEGDDLRTLHLDLPLGTGLALAAQTTCSAGQFGADTYAAAACPAGSQIGEALLRLSVWHAATARHLALSSAKAYLLPAGADELARIGVTVQPLPSLAPLKFVLRATLLPSGRLRLIGSDLPRALYAGADVEIGGALAPGATPLPTYVESFGLRLWGAKADHPSLAADLAATTTACDVAATGEVSATTYAGAASTLTPDALTASGCMGLDYEPDFEFSVSSTEAGAPAGATLTLAMDGDGTGRLPARTQSAAITLPPGLRIGGQIAAGGLDGCSVGAFATAVGTPAACPSTSVIGTAQATSALTSDPLRGSIFLTPPTESGDVAGLAIELSRDGATAADAPRLKFTGRLSVTDDRLELRFPALPAVPLGSLQLTLRGGDRAVLTTPDACDTVNADASLTAASGATATDSAPLTISTGCAAPDASATVGLAALGGGAGARDGWRLSIAHPDRAPALTNATATLPEGAQVDLRGVARCSRAAIEAATCAADATLGTVRLAIGRGAAPATIAAPISRLDDDGGALATGLARVPVTLGPVELGIVDVPVAVGFDPSTRRLIFATGIPRSVNEQALDLQSIALDVASGVAVNPTMCAGLTVDAAVGLSTGATTQATGAMALDGCDRLALAPEFRAALSGELAVGGHPKMAIAVVPRAGDANLSQVRIALPAGLAVDPTRPTCEASTFNAGACGATGRIGGAAIGSALADGSVAGTLSLVRVPGRALPSVGLTVGGGYGFRALAEITESGGRQVAAFDDLPDLPLSRLELLFDGGAAGGLKVTQSLCAAGAGWRLTAAGHGGQVAESSAALGSCSATAAPVVELGIKEKTGLKLKVNGFGGRRLQAAKLTLSPRMRFRTAVARQGRASSIVAIGAKVKPTFSSTSLTLTVADGKPAQEVVARVRWPALTVSPRGHRKTSFRLRLAFTDGTVQVRDVLVTLPAKLPRPTPTPTPKAPVVAAG
jgi:hypothetical protein